MERCFFRTHHRGLGYSRDSERDDMIRRLEGIMDRARSDSEAMAIRDAIDAINRAA